MHTRCAPPPNPNMSRSAPNMSPFPTHHIPQPSTRAHARSHKRVGTAFARARRARWAPQTSQMLLPSSKKGASGRTTRLQGAVRTCVRSSTTRAFVPAPTHGRLTVTVTKAMTGGAWRARRCRRARYHQARGTVCGQRREAFPRHRWRQHRDGRGRP